MNNDTFAIIEIGGAQEMVRPGDMLEINRVPQKKGKTFSTDKVLLVSLKGKVEIGQPYVKTKVEFKVSEHKRGPKLKVLKFKAKSRYRKTIGHRQELSILEVVKVGTVTAKKPTTPKKKPTKAKAKKKK